MTGKLEGITVTMVADMGRMKQCLTVRYGNLVVVADPCITKTMSNTDDVEIIVTIGLVLGLVANTALWR
jgi:hypothetical protein